MQRAASGFSHDLRCDKMRKQVSQASSAGCQGNISECMCVCVLPESMFKYLHTTFKAEETEMSL